MRVDDKSYQNDVYRTWLEEQFPVILADAQPRVRKEAEFLLAKDLIEDRFSNMSMDECDAMTQGMKIKE
jgi:hypothetical protein